MLTTSRAQYVQAADPVNRQKVDLCCHRNIEQTAEIFRDTYDQLAATANRSSELVPPHGKGVFCLQRPTCFDKRGNLTIVLTLKIHAVGHHFHARIVEGVVRHRDLVAKIKITKFFPGMFVGDSRKFMLAKISRSTVSETSFIGTFIYWNPQNDSIYSIVCIK